MTRINRSEISEIMGSDWTWITPVSQGLSNIATSIFAPEPVVVQKPAIPWLAIGMGAAGLIILGGLVIKISKK